MRKTLLFIFILLCCSTFCMAFSNGIKMEPKDSLLMLLNRAQQDTARIRLLKQLIDAAQNSEKEKLRYAQELFTLAKKNNNHDMQCLAIYYQMVSYSNLNDTLRFNQCMKELPHYNNKTLFYQDIYFQACYMQTELWISFEEYEKARSKAFAMLGEAQKEQNLQGELSAYLSLSHIYQATGKTAEAQAVLSKAYELNHKPALIGNYPKLYDTLNMFIYLYNDIEDNEKCLFYLKELETATQEHIKKNPYKKQGYANIFLYIENTYMACYLRLKDMEKCEKHRLNAQRYLAEASYEEYCSDYHFWSHEYYKQKKEYKKALEELNASFYPMAGNVKEVKFLNKKADLLADMGRFKEATLIYKMMLSKEDSIHHATIAKQSQQAQAHYQQDEKDLKHIKKQSFYKQILLCIIIVAYLLVIAALFRTIFVHHKLKKTDKELTKATQNAQKANEEKNEYIATLHQCMKTPLSTVIGFSHALLERNVTEEDYQAYIDIIQKNLEELQVQTKDITKDIKG